MSNDVKVVKLTDRLRNAWKAFKGGSVGSIHFGVEVKRCDKCERVRPPDILYLCDAKQCDNCSYPLCQHTQDINHAVNFQKFKGDHGPCFVERERILTEENV